MTISLVVRLDGSEVLIEALDDHMKTYEFAQQVLVERDELLGKIAALRLLYAEIVHAQRDQMSVDLIVAGWEEIRVNMWRSPQRRVYRGVPSAWHAMRGMNLLSVQANELSTPPPSIPDYSFHS